MEERLKAILNTTDGFAIAEEDLRIRGPGELLGWRQSGSLRLRVADLARDWDTFLEARAEAFALLAGDPGLFAPESAAYRELLARWDRENTDADHGWIL